MAVKISPPETIKVEEGKSATSRFVDLVKFLSTIKGDLANITSPPFFLAPTSVLENPRCWAQTPCVFTAPALERDPEKRCLLVLRMFLTGLRTQFYVGGGPNVSIKKPLNAFLGELFLSSWTDAESNKSTKLVSEQVSHHPPITAVHISNQEHGIRADGYARVEMTFSGTINIRQIGHTIMHIDEFNEDYLIPLPDLQVRGFLSACLYPEISGTYKIISSTGYIAEINFCGKGFIRGKKNSFEARIYHQSDPKKSCRYEASGVWSEGWEVKDRKTGEILEKFDVDGIENKPAPMTIEPVEKQDLWESRRAWNGVISALERGDFGAAAAAKHQVEEAQRQMRLEEKKAGKTWQPLLFSSTPGEQHEVFHRLTKGSGTTLSETDTKGVWKINDECLGTLQRPFRQGVTPVG